MILDFGFEHQPSEEIQSRICNQKSAIAFRILLMTITLDPQLKRALADRIRYYNELGIYDFYRREPHQRFHSSRKSENHCPKRKLS